MLKSFTLKNNHNIWLLQHKISVAPWYGTCLPMQEAQETQVWFLGCEDPLEQETAAHSSILACITLWTEEPGGLQFMGWQRVGPDWAPGHSI